jgi:hypothetical protein
MQFILALHSLFRWLILFFALVTIINSTTGMSGKRPFTGGHKRTALFLMICCDVQLLLGLVLYYMNGWLTVLTGGTSMASKTNRFWSVEHSIGMIVAIILIHLGYAAVKKSIADTSKFKRLFWFTLIAVIIILGTIPWPAREMIGRPLFRGM